MKRKHLGALMIRLWGGVTQDSELGGTNSGSRCSRPDWRNEGEDQQLCFPLYGFTQDWQFTHLSNGWKDWHWNDSPRFSGPYLQGTIGLHRREAPSAFAVATAAQSDAETVAAIQGLATSTTGGGATAVLGTAYGANSIGLFANSRSNWGGGMAGSTASAGFSFSAAIAAWALANAGSAVALFAQTYSPNGNRHVFP